MKQFLFISLILFSAFTMSAQHYGCATDEHLEQLLSDPAQRAAFEQQQEMLLSMQDHIAARERAEHTIPVVVHVLYDNCEGNISMAQIEDGLRVLNEDFRRTNADTALTRAPFKDVAVDSDIEFRLAKLDPDGNPTNGVVRIQTEQAVDAYQNVKSLSYWPSDQYMNIWIVESIQNFTGSGGTILGYAQFPGSGSWNTYGFVVRNDAFGVIGTSNADGRTVTHEIGHCLNLYHTFQGGCGNYCTNSGDYVCDTPPASGATYNCSSTTNTCGNDANGSAAYNTNVPDQIENYMSYNSCQNMFTAGQRTRMKTALNGITQLKNLTSEENLIATGVVGLVNVDFNTDVEVICQSSPVSFQDASSYEGIASTWEFGGAAIPSTSTDSAPSVVFPYAGLHQVSYTAQEDSNQISTTRDVFVAASEGQYAPFTDDMESLNSMPNNQWFAVNVDGDEYEWKITNEAAYSGDQSIKLDNFGKCGVRTDELITQSFDFSPFQSVNVKFKQAFATTAPSNTSYLRAYISTDCGSSWVLIWARTASALRTVTDYISDEPFIPASEVEWQEQSFNVSNATYMTEGVLFKFEFGGLGGNNFYLDDLMINGTFNGDLLLRLPADGQVGLASDVLLDWKSAGYVDSYEYEIDTDPSFNSSNKMVGTNAWQSAAPDQGDTEFMATGLANGTTYYWRVRYVQSGNTSAWSDTWRFEVSETGVGVEAPEAASMRVFPNPSNGNFTVQSPTPIDELLVRDISGRVVWMQSALGTNQVDVDIHLPAGSYIVEASDANQVQRQVMIIR